MGESWVFLLIFLRTSMPVVDTMGYNRLLGLTADSGSWDRILLLIVSIT